METDEQRFKNIIEKLCQGIIIFEGPSFTISFSNSTASGLMGYSTEELKKLSFNEFANLINWMDRNKVLMAFQRIFSGEIDDFEIDVRLNTKSNEMIWVQLSIVSIISSSGKSIAMTLIDIHKQHQAIADLTDSAKDLELYASILRHDLKNDLQVIVGNADVIRLSAPDNEMVQQYADASIAGAERMLDFLNIFGKPEAQKSRNISQILEEISVEAAHLYVGMRCLLHIDQNAMMVRVVGGRMLSMVFRNLISNSAKYAGKSARVDIQAKREGSFIEIRISDDGPGIAEEIKSRLFSKGASTSGSGLGLYLSRRIIEAYGGTLELIDTGDNETGAEFMIRLVIASD